MARGLMGCKSDRRADKAVEWRAEVALDRGQRGLAEEPHEGGHRLPSPRAQLSWHKPKDPVARVRRARAKRGLALRSAPLAGQDAQGRRLPTHRPAGEPPS